MTEETFRWVVAAGVAIVVLSAIVQAFVLASVASAVRKLKEKAEPLIDKAEPAIGQVKALVEKSHPVIEKISGLSDKAGDLVANVNRLVNESRPKINQISDEAVAIVKSGHEQVDKVGELLQDAAGRARTRLDQIDLAFDGTVAHVEQVSEQVKRAVMRPVREVSGVAAGISAAVSALRRKKAPVDAATQDEEMFI